MEAQAQAQTALRPLLHETKVAALATLHQGEPAVSMVPYALRPDGRFTIHVSRLATHTQDMLAHERVSLHALSIMALRCRLPQVPASSGRGGVFHPAGGTHLHGGGWLWAGRRVARTRTAYRNE